MDPANTWKIHHPIYESDVLNPDLMVSPWSGHRDFAYDWIAFSRPRRIVELGTHYGCSLFSFAQADKDLRLGCELFAVDTWQGDPDAGFYGEDVYALVDRTVRERFQDVSIQLIRKTFSEALSDFDDSVISILHIDGFHSYDAAKEDFESWRDKLEENAVVFFHDIAPSSGYGSAKYWEDIREHYPHFEFLEHSFGLGILFPKGDYWYRCAKKSGLDLWIDFYRYRSQARLFERQLLDQTRMLDERWRVLKDMEGMILERDATIRSQAKLLDERWNVMDNMESMIRDRDITITDQEKLIEERWIALGNMESIIQDREMVLSKLQNDMDDFSRDASALLSQAMKLVLSRIMRKNVKNGS